MPISSSAVTGDFSPTHFYTHTLKSGEPIESVRPDVTPNQVEADLSTIDSIPNAQNGTKGAFYSTKLFKVCMGVLLAIVVAAAVAIPLGIILSQSHTTTTTTTAATKTTSTTIFANTSSATVTSTTSTVSTTTTQTTTTQTTTTTGASFACSGSEVVYGVWNTTAGGDSSASPSGSGIGNYYPTEPPSYACDNTVSTEYTNFGPCTSSNSLTTCGLNTGFYRTPLRGPSLVIALQVCTGRSITSRDPLTITLEGSNQPASALTLGSSWTLLYSGISGLANDPGRHCCGTPQLFLSNTVWYTSYRFLVTSKRAADSSTWYSEVQLIGY